MKTLRALMALVVGVGCLASIAAPAADASSGKKIRALVVTGGHGFEKEPFFKLFKDNPDISYTAAEHPKAQALWKADAAKDYDVLVFYDMHQEISAGAKADFLALLKEGKGLVVLHHAIANYQAWPEYSKIIGARYYLEKTSVDGVEKARSAYKHDVDFSIHVADPKHPVTQGVQDFKIHDETYRLFDVFSDCHTLLTTEEPESNPVIGWWKTYEKSRVVYLQSGHDHLAYENPNFERILRQAIRWTANRPDVP